LDIGHEYWKTQSRQGDNLIMGDEIIYMNHFLGIIVTYWQSMNIIMILNEILNIVIHSRAGSGQIEDNNGVGNGIWSHHPDTEKPGVCEQYLKNR
jgi:hypothetical protein